MERIDVVIPSAGSGSRMGMTLPKQFARLAGIPLIIHPLRAFQSIEWIGQLIIVHGPGQSAQLTEILKEHGVKACMLVEGGRTRQESVRRGLSHVTTPRVIVHNAAVALVEKGAIERVASITDDCVTTATPLEVNIVSGDDFAEKALPKHRLKVINSPQCFITSVLRDCHRQAVQDAKEFSSETELMLHYQRRVRLVAGSARSFKITTPIDLIVAEAILAQELRSASAPAGLHASS